MGSQPIGSASVALPDWKPKSKSPPTLRLRAMKFAHATGKNPRIKGLPFSPFPSTARCAD